MCQFPPEMADWKLRADWLLSGFFPTAKSAKNQLQELLELLNGNSKEQTFIHYCLPGCCQDDQEALQKVIRVAIPLCSRGYQVPLLYRWKHYTVASSYIRTTCCCFGLLPQVLKQLNANVSSADSHVVDALLQTDGSSVDQALNDLLENDLSYSVQNSVRRRKVVDEVKKGEFSQSAIMIDTVVSALEYASNSLFKRTSILTRLSMLGSLHPEYMNMATKSMESFLNIVSGAFGANLVHRTALLLDDGLQETIEMGGLVPTPERLTLFFRLVVSCMTDVWRRMIWDYSRYPFKWFEILSCDFTLEQFAQRWDEILKEKSRGCSCIDTEFSRVLLAECPSPMSEQSTEVQAAIHKEVKEILTHIAMFSPMTADSVEIKHGNMQWSISKRSATHVKKGKAAVETAFLQTCVHRHGFVQAEVSQMTLPPGRTQTAIERQVGVASKNQHTASKTEALGLF